MDFNTIKLFAINGRISKSIENSNVDEINIDVSDYTRGIYIILVLSDIQSIHKKVIIA